MGACPVMQSPGPSYPVPMQQPYHQMQSMLPMQPMQGPARTSSYGVMAPGPVISRPTSYEVAPAYGAPTYNAPVVTSAPSYGAPSYGAPSYGAPVYGAPMYPAGPMGPTMTRPTSIE